MTSNLGSFGLAEADGVHLPNAKLAVDDLRQIVSQLAGLMLPSDTTGRRAFADCSLFARAKDLLSEVEEHIGVLRLRLRSGHHDRHLRHALALLKALFKAIDTARIGIGGADCSLSLLKAAWRELVHASNALPGFETIDLSQSCCAGRVKLRKASIIACEGAPP